MGAVLFAEHGDIAAQRGKSVAVVLDKDGGAGAARQGFETERAGAGEGVEHRPVGERQPGGGKVAVRQDVEQGLAGPVAGRAHRLAGGRREPPPAMDCRRRCAAPVTLIGGGFASEERIFDDEQQRPEPVIDGPASAKRPDSSLTAA